MSFPTITYRYNGIEDAKALVTIVDQKFSVLQKFLERETAVSCDVEFEKVTAHQQGRIFRVEANLSVGGKLYRAEATEESFEKAIDEVRDELDQELRRAKDKQVSLEKRGGREIKEQMLS